MATNEREQLECMCALDFQTESNYLCEASVLDRVFGPGFESGISHKDKP